MGEFKMQHTFKTRVAVTINKEYLDLAATVLGISGAPSSDTITLDLTLEEIHNLVDLHKIGIIKAVERLDETEQEFVSPIRALKTATRISSGSESSVSIESSPRPRRTHDFIEI